MKHGKIKKKMSTNQRGSTKGLMAVEDLKNIHIKMIEDLKKSDD